MEMLTIRLPKSLARKFRAKTRAAGTTPTAVSRKAAEEFVRADPSTHNSALMHVRRFAGSWDGYCSGEDLLRRTRL